MANKAARDALALLELYKPHIEGLKRSVTMLYCSQDLVILRANRSGTGSASKYSDLTIKCGKRTWSVHKVIVCLQSSFFAKACDGQFKVRTHLLSSRR